MTNDEKQYKSGYKELWDQLRKLGVSRKMLSDELEFRYVIQDQLKWEPVLYPYSTAQLKELNNYLDQVAAEKAKQSSK